LRGVERNAAPEYAQAAGVIIDARSKEADRGLHAITVSRHRISGKLGSKKSVTGAVEAILGPRTSRAPRATVSLRSAALGPQSATLTDMSSTLMGICWHIAPETARRRRRKPIACKTGEYVQVSRQRNYLISHVNFSSKEAVEP
jgi:hypothetical protein